jgi:uncharacterized membrane protein required for colicin V production
MEVLTSFIDYLKDAETPFGIFDLVYAVYFVFAFFRGFFRGFPEELSRLLGTGLIFFASIKFYQPFSEFIIHYTRLDDPLASKALAYLLIFLCLLIAWKLLTYLIHKTLDWTCPKQLRQFGGALVGLVKSAIIVSVILSAVLISGHRSLTESMVENSWFGRTAQQLLPAHLLPETASTEEGTESDGTGNP